MSRTRPSRLEQGHTDWSRPTRERFRHACEPQSGQLGIGCRMRQRWQNATSEPGFEKAKDTRMGIILEIGLIAAGIVTYWVTRWRATAQAGE